MKLFAVLALVFPTWHASATIVTNGFIKIVGGVPTGNFALLGNDFSAIGVFDAFYGGLSNMPCVGPCSVNVGGLTSSPSIRGGSAIVSGKDYGFLNWSGVGVVYWHIVGLGRVWLR